MNDRNTMNNRFQPPGQRCFPLFPGGFFLLLLLWLSGCQAEQRHVTPAFYFWKTQLALSPSQQTYLDSLHCRDLYIKFLDVARPAGETVIRPYALLEVTDTTGLSGKNIIPCVFITNSVFLDISASQIDWLAEKTQKALTSVSSQFPQRGFTEVQFDCDWTDRSRNSYFLFLQKIRPLLPPRCTLSATIRLHQYKFPNQTGIPPTDRGMLMLYNTGNIDAPDAVNSIFQPADARKYLIGAEPSYPLKLDVALPVFSWALVYRNATLWKIVPAPEPDDLADSSRYQQIPTPPPGHSAAGFEVRKATFLGGHYLRPGDLVRLEWIDRELLRQATALAAGTDLAPDARVAFYHLDTLTPRQFPADFLIPLWKTLNDSD
ncbi:MAG: hypothetical protein EP344_10375 [Bacteroidetes bacterium]|nr:MAG: hypothetical protein EP344_10375 [Bacteroidota bacterium]